MNDFIMIPRDDFDFLTEYVERIKPSFYDAKNAVRVQEIFKNAITMRPSEVIKDEEKK